MTQKEYNSMARFVAAYIEINGYRKTAEKTGVSVNTLKRVHDNETIRPSTAQKLYDWFLIYSV